MTVDPRLTAPSDPGMMTSSRFPILLALVFSSLSPVLSHSNREMWFQDLFPPNTCPINAKTNTFYGIMFDAGSTGTRIHIYTFVQKSPGKTLCQSVHLPYVDSGSVFTWEDFVCINTEFGINWRFLLFILQVLLRGVTDCHLWWCFTVKSSFLHILRNPEVSFWVYWISEDFHLCSCLKECPIELGRFPSCLLPGIISTNIYILYM